MSFRISITVADNKLASTLKQLNGFKFQVENVADAPKPKALPNPDKPRTGRVAMDTYLSVGARAPNPGTNNAHIVKALQKLEVKHGPHSVTRAMLRDALTRNTRLASWISNTGLVDAIKGGYLEASS